MEKLILTALLAIFLLAPQTGLQAAGNPAINDINARIDDINARIDDVDTRIDDLEQPGSPETDLVFSGDFVGGVAARFSLKVDWANFKSSATGSFSSIEIMNSLGGSVKCSTSETVDDIVNELNTHVPVEGSIASFDCVEPDSGQLVKWNVGFCGGEVEFNASLKEAVCECGHGAVVRPLHPSVNWGGVGTEFGGTILGDSSTCGAPSQKLEVILTR